MKREDLIHMDHITQELIDNGLTLRNQGCPRPGGPDAGRGGKGVGRSTAYPATLGTGREHATSLHAGSPAPAHGDFSCLPAEHEAEADYQGFLAEVEAEHLSRLEEEAAGPLFAFLARYAGEEVAA